MAESWDGCGNTKFEIKLDGNTVIKKDDSVLDFSIEPAASYRKVVLYIFDTEDEAREYYYKKR